MFYLFLFMFLLSSKLPPISGCTKVLPSSPAFPLPEVPLTPRESDSHSDCRPLFLWIKELGQDRMGHQLPHCRKHMEERLLTHTICTAWVVQTQDQSSQITQRLGSLVHKSIPSPCTPRQWCLYLSSPFLPIYKYLFSFPHQICMTDPARAGILQVKPG